MFTLQNLVQPESIDEAYKILTQRKTNTVLGGCAFLKMGSKRIGTAIELSNLDLNYIKEDDKYIEIGAMTTFRDLETSDIVNKHFNGVLAKSVSNIVGVQFRNVVTVGATIFSKYGFSDFITALLSLDSEVELFGQGRMTLEEFLNKSYERDILTRIFIKKNNIKSVFKDFRNSISDYSLINVAVSVNEGYWKIVVGARPRGATIAKDASELLSKGNLTAEEIDKVATMVSEELTFGTNMRATEEYRKALCNTLVKTAVMEVLECK